MLHERIRITKEEAAALKGADAVLLAPAPRMALILPGVILALLLVGLLWACFTHIDIVSQTTARTIPSSRVKMIQPSELAVLDLVLVEEGQSVQAGDPLVTFDPTDADADQRRLEADLLDHRLEVARLAAMASATERGLGHFVPPAGAPKERVAEERERLKSLWGQHRAEIATHDRRIDNLRAEVARLNAEVDRLTKLLPFTERQADRMHQLFERGYAPQAKLDEVDQSLAQSRLELVVQRRQRDAALAAVAVAEAERTTAIHGFSHDALEKQHDAEAQITEMEQDLRKARRRHAMTTLYAPVSGTVLDLAVHSHSGVVEPAQVLMKIVPADSPLEVEAKVLNRDIGFVHEGQKVEVKFETYTFTKYGAIPGIVRKVGQDATTDEKLGPIYRTLVDLQRDWMMVDGQKVKLKPGMSATVDIRTGRRRPIEYILAPMFRYKDEALRER